MKKKSGMNTKNVRLSDKQSKDFESPDGGKTVYERYFGESKRRLVEPNPKPIEIELEAQKKSAFVQYGKDEHEVYLTEDAFGQLISTQNEEPMEVVTGTLMDFEQILSLKKMKISMKRTMTKIISYTTSLVKRKKKSGG